MARRDSISNMFPFVSRKTIWTSEKTVTFNRAATLAFLYTAGAPRTQQHGSGAALLRVVGFVLTLCGSPLLSAAFLGLYCDDGARPC